MGNANPFVALARAVERRGVRAEILTNPGLAHFFEREGLAVRRVGEPVDVFRFIAENPRFMGPRGRRASRRRSSICRPSRSSRAGMSGSTGRRCALSTGC